jgi:hypothetical protein
VRGDELPGEIGKFFLRPDAKTRARVGLAHLSPSGEPMSAPGRTKRESRPSGGGAAGKPRAWGERIRGRLPGRLNLFQAAMLEWRDHHPYNAVHAARLARPLDRAALVAAIERELTGAGLVGLAIDRARGRYVWRGTPSPVVLETVAPDGDWTHVLGAVFERHLNTPFPRDGAIEPFRFFALDDGDGFFLGLAYDHFIAGGDSIVALLEAIAARYVGSRTESPALRLYPPTHARLFARHPWHFLRGLARFPALAASCRRTIRPRYRDIADGYNAFRFFPVGHDDYLALRRSARCWGVTLNDALMALLLAVQHDAMPARDMKKRRRELAVASIVNLRSAHGDDAHRTFGQYLGSFRVSHAMPAGATLADVAADVHRATTRVKRERIYLATLFAMAVDRQIGRLQTERQRMGIYAKNYPVGAGVSSLDVDALWHDAASKPPLYVRGVPTGPLSPIVAAVTTCGERMCIGLSFRTTALSRDDAEAVGRGIVTRIHALAHEINN